MQMTDWKKILGESPIDWLLEKSNPSVRYFTLRDIVGKPDDDFETMNSKMAIQESAVVQKILQKQNPQGFWEKADSPYLPKYKASYWTLMVLGIMGMDKANPKVAKACQFIFQFQNEEGGFQSEYLPSSLREYQYRSARNKKLPSKSEFVSSLMFESQLSCLTGNMVAALVRMGYGGDSRVKKAVDWLVQIQNGDGGWLCPYWKAHVKDKHGCFMGTICSLEAFSEIPSDHMTERARATVSRGAEFLLMHCLFKADHHDFRTIKQVWLELSFPWFFSYNILRSLDVLTKLGYGGDPRIGDAVEIILKKRQKNGTWILENSPMGRMHANLEQKGESSKWITLIAMRTLKRLYN